MPGYGTTTHQAAQSKKLEVVPNSFLSPAVNQRILSDPLSKRISSMHLTATTLCQPKPSSVTFFHSCPLPNHTGFLKCIPDNQPPSLQFPVALRTKETQAPSMAYRPPLAPVCFDLIPTRQPLIY